LTRSERTLNSLFNPYEKNEGRARLNNRLSSEKSSMADLSLADLLYDFGARRKEERERQNRLEEFEQLFGPRPGPGQSPRRSDPINLPGDLTRQEVNPVTSRGLEHYSSAKSRDPLNPFRDLQHPDGGVRRGFDDPLQGTAGRRLPGSVGGPTKPEEIQIKPQPTILPIPRRQF
jgi:hypothetical protein